jgi:hypothetical protein
MTGRVQTTRSTLRRAAVWMRGRAGTDRGDASVSMAIVFPFIIALTIAVVQASMWYYARTIALTAAREGVTAARLYQAAPAAGTARARETLQRIAADNLRDAQVTSSGTATGVRITVTGSVPSMLPGMPGLHIAQSASAPRERWTTSGG